MKRILFLMAVGIALALPVCANLVPNPGFEDGGKGWAIPDAVMQIDNAVFHSGKASLRTSWDTPDKRKLAIHEIPVKPGKRYLIKAWLKSKDVQGAAKGATFGVEWCGKQGFLGGSGPTGVGFDLDWTEITFLSGVVPNDATYAHIYATIDYSGVGTAWIDDISVEEVDVSEAFGWAVKTSTVIGTNDSAPFEVTVHNKALSVFGEDVDVSVSLCSPPWNNPLSEQKICPAKSETLTFPTGSLNEGVYKFSAVVKERGTGRTLTEPLVLTAYKRPPMQCLTVPHSGVILPGNGYPAVDVRAYRSGELLGEIVDAGGKTVAKLPARSVQVGKDVRLSAKGKPGPGRYEARLGLKSAGSPGYTCSLPFTVLTASEAAKGTIIGPDNLLLDRGKKWFPMFVYAHTAFDYAKLAELPDRDPKLANDVLDHLQGTPFGLLDYATSDGGLDATVALADECAKRGIRLALSVKDVYPGWWNLTNRAKGFPGQTTEQMVRSLAKRLRNHPAMAIYYTNDELSTQYFGAMKDMRRWLHEEDPLHPTLHVHYDLECLRELAPTYDMMGPELYPWPSDELTQMPKWSDTVTSSLPKTAPFWGCLWHFKNEPQGSEKLRALAYLAIAKGARAALLRLLRTQG